MNEIINRSSIGLSDVNWWVTGLILIILMALKSGPRKPDLEIIAADIPRAHPRYVTDTVHTVGRSFIISHFIPAQTDYVIWYYHRPTGHVQQHQVDSTSFYAILKDSKIKID